MNRKRLIICFVMVVLIIISGGFVYANNIISNVSKIIFESIEEENWRVEDYILFPPSMKLVLTYSIRNPTKTPVKVEMDIDFYAGDYKISNLKYNQNILPGDKSTFEIELDYTYEILEKIYGNVEGYDKFTMDGRFKVKGNILFYSVESTIIFNGEDVSSILPLFDTPF